MWKKKTFRSKLVHKAKYIQFTKLTTRLMDEHEADHGGSKSGEADQQQLNPSASSQLLLPGVQALARVLPSRNE